MIAILSFKSLVSPIFILMTRKIGIRNLAVFLLPFWSFSLLNSLLAWYRKLFESILQQIWNILWAVILFKTQKVINIRALLYRLIIILDNKNICQNLATCQYYRSDRKELTPNTYLLLIVYFSYCGCWGICS